MDKYRHLYSHNSNELFKDIDDKLKNLGFDYYKKGNYDLMEQTGAAHDALMALNPKFGMGHSASYWKIAGNKEREFIAHMFENKYIGNEIQAKVRFRVRYCT